MERQGIAVVDSSERERPKVEEVRAWAYMHAYRCMQVHVQPSVLMREVTK